MVQSARWKGHRNAAQIVRKAVTAAAAAASTACAELAIVLTDDSAIRSLNRDWRQIDKATNVLSFPIADRGGRGAAPAMLGDIVIAYETVAREAQTEHKPFLHHLAHPGVHGFLHLCGHDHESDPQADAMEDLERRILARLDIPDPYGAREAGA